MFSSCNVRTFIVVKLVTPLSSRSHQRLCRACRPPCHTPAPTSKREGGHDISRGGYHGTVVNLHFVKQRAGVALHANQTEKPLPKNMWRRSRRGVILQLVAKFLWSRCCCGSGRSLT
ncbi:hypothetical protein J6590_032884 [Homalodisca vitripennis]|nr:hypothetical protein J6590_032884 [Homalodisca vitripennis]